MAFPSNLIPAIFIFLILPSSKAGLVDDVCSHAKPDPKYLIPAIFIFLILPSSKAGLVDDVCSHAKPDPKYCISTFSVDSGADLATLGETAINSAQSTTELTISVLNKVVGGTSDPTQKKRYIFCFNSYNETYYDLADGRWALKGKDYEKLSLQASSALKASQSCDEQFVSSSQQPFKDSGVKVQTITSALVYISSQLKQGH